MVRPSDKNISLLHKKINHFVGRNFVRIIRVFLIIFFFFFFYYPNRHRNGYKYGFFHFVRQLFSRHRFLYWPVHSSSLVTGVENIELGVGADPGVSPGCYIQGVGKIAIGDYTIVAPNVGIISANHNLYDYFDHEAKSVTLGSYCWIGMNSVILPGVTLGDHTIVAAGSVVTKSFDGYCVVAGNPAKVIKTLDPHLSVEKRWPAEFRGYIPARYWNGIRKFFISN